MIAITGFVLLIFTAVLWRKYRPRMRDSRVLCGIAAVMGLMALVSGPAGWQVQLLQCSLQTVVGCCCFVQLRHEKRLRHRRRSLRLRREPKDEVKSCA